jgi:hypothetical protein
MIDFDQATLVLTSKSPERETKKIYSMDLIQRDGYFSAEECFESERELVTLFYDTNHQYPIDEQNN